MFDLKLLGKKLMIILILENILLFINIIGYVVFDFRIYGYVSRLFKEWN